MNGGRAKPSTGGGGVSTASLHARVAGTRFYQLYIKRAKKCQVSLAVYSNGLSTHKFNKFELYVNLNFVTVMHINLTTKKHIITEKRWNYNDDHYCLHFLIIFRRLHRKFSTPIFCCIYFHAKVIWLKFFAVCNQSWEPIYPSLIFSIHLYISYLSSS